MNREDLIKHITESLEKTLPKDFVYSFPYVQTSIGVNDVIYSAEGKVKVVNREFEIKIDFNGDV